MRVKANADNLAKSIQEAELKIREGLETMVKGLATNIAIEAVNNTPYGNSTLFAGFYESQARITMMPSGSTDAGYAKGGWLVSMNSVPSVEFPDRATDASGYNIKSKAITAGATYNLGDKVYISNHTPYVYKQDWPSNGFGSLEQGYSRQAPIGISAPTTDKIMQVFKQDLKYYYDSSKQ